MKEICKENDNYVGDNKMQEPSDIKYRFNC